MWTRSSGAWANRMNRSRRWSRKGVALGAIAVAALLVACERNTERAEEESPAPAATQQMTVRLTPDEQERYGVRVAPVIRSEATQSSRGVAIALDGALLAATLADLEALRTDEQVARNSFVRLHELAKAGDASRLAEETARSAAAQASARYESARARARIDWGRTLVDGANAAGKDWRAAALSGRLSLFRAEFSADLPDDAANLTFEFARHAPIKPGNVRLTFVERSRAAVQATSGAAVLLAAETTSPGPAIDWRPGARFGVFASRPGGAAQVLVPPAALVAESGRLWCYIMRPEREFVRLEVRADAETAHGFPVAAQLSGDEQVVIQGAATLLSLERVATTPTPSDD